MTSKEPNLQKEFKPLLLMEVAVMCRNVIDSARVDGLIIDDGNVVDLCADNIEGVSLSDIRCALVVSGYGNQFPKATSGFPVGNVTIND